MLLRRSSLLCLALLLAAACSDPRGSIEGTVTVAGSTLDGVLVSISGSAQSPAEDGTFVFAALPLGTYHVTATKEGYAPVSTDVTVEENKAARADLALTEAQRAPKLQALVAKKTTLAPGETTELVATVADADPAALTWTWSAPEGWTVTGTGASVQLTAPVQYDTSAVVTVVAATSGGLSDSASTTVQTRANQAPIFSSVVARPNPVAPGGTVQVTVGAADPNGDALTFTWAVGEGWTVSGTGNEATVTAPATHDAATTVTVTADDGHGKTTATQVPLATTPNRAPIVASLVATPPQVRPGGTVTLEASAADPDGEPLTYTWIAPAGWTFSGTGASGTLTAPQEYGQIATVALQVADPSGAVAVARVVLSTTTNSGPLVHAITALPAQARPGAEQTLSVSAADPDGDALTYEWTAPAGWTIRSGATAAQAVFVAPNAYGRSGTATVTVSDGDKRAASSVVLATNENRTPAIASLVARPTPVFRGKTVAVQASASDPDGDALTYAWTVPTGWTLVGTGASVQVTAPDEYDQSGTVQLTVSDAGGLAVSAQVPVATAADRAPAIASATATPTPVRRGGTVQLAVSASDPDGDALTYAWTAPAGWTVTGSGASVQLTAPDQYDQSGTVTVRVADGHGLEASAQIPVATAQNRAPLLASIVPARSPIPRGANTTVTASASDPDGDTLSYAWTAPSGWTVTGTGAAVQLTAPSTPSRATLGLVVSDGAGGQVSGSLVVETTNLNPVVTSFPSQQVLPNQTVLLTAVANDPEGAPLNYAFTKRSAATDWTVAFADNVATVIAPARNDAEPLELTVLVDDGVSVTSATATLTIKACGTGLMNCDGSATNGCEATLNTDANNCGQCNNHCSAPTGTCSAGICIAGASCGPNLLRDPQQTKPGWTACYLPGSASSTLRSTPCNQLFDSAGKEYGCWHGTCTYPYENCNGVMDNACYAGVQNTTRYSDWGGTAHILTVCIKN